MLKGDGNGNGNKINKSNLTKVRRSAQAEQIIFMEELSYVLTNNFVPCVPVRFFFTAAHFHLAGR